MCIRSYNKLGEIFLTFGSLFHQAKMIIAGQEIPVYHQQGAVSGDAAVSTFSYLEFTLAFTIATFVLEYYLDWYEYSTIRFDHLTYY